jgi:hypothetical protein
MSTHYNNLDWRIVGNQAEVELGVRVVLENTTTHSQLVFEKPVIRKIQKDLITTNPSRRILVVLLTAEEMANIPIGSYQASVYVKNKMTKKYNAWLKEVIK